MEHVALKLRVNGETRQVYVPANKTLLEVLREDLNLTGTKHGCETGECGACTVLVNRKPVNSCLVLPIQVQGQEIMTIEALGGTSQPHALQEEWAKLGATQCGYCSPGIIMSAHALLEKHPHPTRDEIKETVSGHICRCTGYHKIIEAVENVAARNQAAPEKVEVGD